MTGQDVDHAICAEALRKMMSILGAEIRVLEHPPLASDVFAVEPWTCPHGTRYWPYPTEAQQRRYLSR